MLRVPEASSVVGVATTIEDMMGWTQIQVEAPEVPPSLRGSVRFCSSKVLLHCRRSTCRRD
jgi:hypothetical protein